MKKVFLKISQNSQKKTTPEPRFHLDYFLLFLRFPLLTLSIYLFAGKSIEQQLLLFESLKYLIQQTNTYSKLATETLKQDVKSLLTTCNVSKTFVKCFSGVLWTCLYLLWLFYFYDFFLDILLSILNRFHTLMYFFCYQLLEVLSRMLGWVKVNKITKSSSW